MKLFICTVLYSRPKLRNASNHALTQMKLFYKLLILLAVFDVAFILTGGLFIIQLAFRLIGGTYLVFLWQMNCNGLKLF